MNESGGDEPNPRQHFSKEQVVDMLSQARKEVGIRHPAKLNRDDPASTAFTMWTQQENPYGKDFSPQIAFHLWKLDRTMAEFDAGFDDPEFLDELGREFLMQDLQKARSDRNIEGMNEVIEKIKKARNKVVRKLRRSKV